MGKKLYSSKHIIIFTSLCIPKCIIRKSHYPTITNSIDNSMQILNFKIPHQKLYKLLNANDPLLEKNKHWKNF